MFEFEGKAGKEKAIMGQREVAREGEEGGRKRRVGGRGVWKKEECGRKRRVGGREDGKEGRRQGMDVGRL